MSGALARAAEAGHAVLHVGEEALARLLAVVADVDARVELCGDRRAVASSTASRSSLGSTASPRLRRPCSSASACGRGQAAGVRGQDAVVARQHRAGTSCRTSQPPVGPDVFGNPVRRAPLGERLPALEVFVADAGSHPLPCGRTCRTAR